MYCRLRRRISGAGIGAARFEQSRTRSRDVIVATQGGYVAAVRQLQLTLERWRWLPNGFMKRNERKCKAGAYFSGPWASLPTGPSAVGHQVGYLEQRRKRFLVR
jgi:hypothetical protein